MTLLRSRHHAGLHLWRQNTMDGTGSFFFVSFEQRSFLDGDTALGVHV